MDFSLFFDGLLNMFQPLQMMWLVIGVTLGLIAGTLPGISGTTMLSVLLVFVNKIPTDCAVIAMAGIYAASTYSGSTGGILYNVPGDAPGIPSTIEGYPLTKQGRSLEALTAALSGSFFGAVVSFILMIVTVPLFLYLVTFIGTGERALFALWALVIITSGALSRSDMLYGLASMAVGLFLGTIGMQKNFGTIRYVSGQPQLWDGLALLWIILGIYAIPQLIRLPDIKLQEQQKLDVSYFPFLKNCFGLMRKEKGRMMKASLLGTLIGAIPGIGSTTAAWIGYSAAEKGCKDSKFGKGDIRGIIGAEAANNAAVPGTFIPLLALGIPGSAANAIIMGAFVAADLYPGPSLMQNNGTMVWTILMGIGFSAVIFLLLGAPFIKMAQKMVMLPNAYLIAFIGVLSLLGTYLAKYSVFGVIVTVVIGLISIFGPKFGLDPSSMLLGYILGPSIEVEFIRSYQIAGFSRFLKPGSLVLLVLIVATVAWAAYKSLKARQEKGKLSKSEMLEKKFEDQIEDKPERSAPGKDLAFGIIGLALAGYMAYSLRDVKLLVKLWPMLIEIVFLGIPCVLMIIRSLSGKRRLRFEKGGLGKAFAALRSQEARSGAINLIVIIGGFTLAALLIDVIGFTMSSALFAAIILFYYGRNWKTGLIGTAVFGVCMYLMRVLCAFPLPTGIFHL